MIADKQVKSVVQPLPEEQQQNFDYSALDPEIESVVKQRALEIKSLIRRTIQENIEIGQKLIDVKQKLKHGQFKGWIQSEFGWGHTTACKFMHLAENSTEVLKFSFCEKSIQLSALYLIGSPNTPQEARQELLKLAEEGQLITHKTVCRVIAQHIIASINLITSPDISQGARQELITSPYIPQEARQELLKLAEEGQIITHKTVRKIIAMYKDQENQSLDEMPAKVGIDTEAKPLEDDSAVQEQLEEKLQRKEARLAEPEICPSSDDAPASLPKQVLDDAVEEDQSKEEPLGKEVEAENFAPGSSNSSVKLLEPGANETDNHPTREDEANDDVEQAQESAFGDRLSEESPLVNETSNQQDKAKGKANQSPHSGENGACTHVAENPETSVEQQQQRTQPPPRVKQNDSTKVDLGDRNDPQIHDDSDASIFNNNLQNINAKQRVKQIVFALDIAKTQLNVSNWAKAEIAEFVADVENCVAKLERLAKELKQKLENEHL